ncbi:MAG: hypothetical protein LBC40_04650, partial [Dysgonamonadaceae bacterium]|nr:hypothetical protein [Dysgonamonadaceae bacterium]
MRERVYLILCCLLSVAYPSSGQTLPEGAVPLDTAARNLVTQMTLFPQEKIYIQTDRPYYTAGEKIFYRAYLLDACRHRPVSLSRYIYVELVNPFNSVEIRKQIRTEESGLYGAMILPENLPGGNYRIRAYTRYMENVGDDFFYSKPVYVTSCEDSIKMEFVNVKKLNDKQTWLELRFLNARTNDVMYPGKINFRLNGEKVKSAKPEKDGRIRLKLNLPDDSPDRNILVEYMVKDRELYKEYRIINRDKLLFSQYERIPFTEKGIDLSFYPEGGSVVENAYCNVAFKALLPDGSTAGISGRIVDSNGNTVDELRTKHDGMGFFRFRPDSGKTFHAEFEFEGRPYKTALPQFKQTALALQTVWKQENLIVRLNRHPVTPLPELYILVHCRGNIIYFGEWDRSKEVLLMDRQAFPSGVSHILLLTGDFLPVSERLVFLNKNDHATAEITLNKPSYVKREYAGMDITLKGGNRDISVNTDVPDSVACFSISVTDDKKVIPDTTAGILSQILLTSELKGNISSPAWYLSDDPEAVAAADLLMMTHGWTRYDIPDALRGEFRTPEVLPETSQSFSGTVKKGLNNRAANRMDVSLLSYSNEGKYFDVTRTDENGRYRFEGIEQTDSTVFLIQALRPRGSKYMLELFPDPVTYPEVSGCMPVPSQWMDDPVFEEYVLKKVADTPFEDDSKVIALPEITVMGKRKRVEKYPNIRNIKPDYFLTDDDIEKIKPLNVKHLLSLLPGAVIIRDRIAFIHNGVQQGGIRDAVVIINGVIFRPKEEDYENEHEYLQILNLLSLEDIGQINLVNRPLISSFYNLGDDVPIVEIITKSGNGLQIGRRRFNFIVFFPLGYSKPVEFYSPKYDTPEAFNSEKIDLRTTVYWKP